MYQICTAFLSHPVSCNPHRLCKCHQPKEFKLNNHKHLWHNFCIRHWNQVSSILSILRKLQVCSVSKQYYCKDQRHSLYCYHLDVNNHHRYDIFHPPLEFALNLFLCSHPRCMWDNHLKGLGTNGWDSLRRSLIAIEFEFQNHKRQIRNFYLFHRGECTLHKCYKHLTNLRFEQCYCKHQLCIQYYLSQGEWSRYRRHTFHQNRLFFLNQNSHLLCKNGSCRCCQDN